MLAALRRRLAERDSRGFTLIELIIVVVILGILTAIAIPSYGGIQDKARVSTNQENLQISVKMIEAYKAKHGEYPKTGDKGGWSYQRNDPSGPDRNKYIPGLVPEFVNELPMPSNKETQFVYNSDGNDYKIIVYSNVGFKDSEWSRVPSSMKDKWGAAYLDRYGYWSEGFAGV